MRDRPATPTPRGATPWVAFIRAINGSPVNRIRNAVLLDMIADAGCQDLAADGHTGNVFLRAEGEPEAVAVRIEQRLARDGLKNAEVMLRTPAELARLVQSEPFAHLDRTSHDAEATFFRRAPQVRNTSFLVERGGIVAHLDETVLCLAWARPTDGSRARLAGGPNPFVEQHWRVPATSRAWQVVERVQGNCERWLRAGAGPLDEV